MIDGKKAIYWAVLNQGEIAVELSQTINMVLQTSPYPIFVDYSCEKPISYNRNQIVKRFLERKQYDYLIMLDGDIVPPSNLLALVDYDLDIIGALCFAFSKKMIFPLILKRWKKAKKDRLSSKYVMYDSIDPAKWQGLTECDAIGTGCIIIKREVLEKVVYPFRNEYDKTGEKKLGLDLNFCYRAKKLGYKVFCHTDYLCSHHTRTDLKTIFLTIKAITDENLRLNRILEENNIKYSPSDFKFLENDEN